ncbi:hypothetical protein I5E72_10100 [Proteus terrae]|uniref:hypothetical protein n=1 Tax=Proteus terrae TaxID=1574161 RepID=UPI0018C597EB|nr:hypothetical protein [Proteus terrae]MBG5950094.1 hypothetical protein [Proteus terrae]
MKGQSKQRSVILSRWQHEQLEALWQNQMSDPKLTHHGLARTLIDLGIQSIQENKHEMRMK